MKLFPRYLNIGSEGPAVTVLQLLLMAQGRNSNIIPDGQYGEQTAIGVRAIQAEACIDQDGNFGPATRTAFRKMTGIDIDAIMKEQFEGETVAA